MSEIRILECILNSLCLPRQVQLWSTVDMYLSSLTFPSNTRMGSTENSPSHVCECNPRREPYFQYYARSGPLWAESQAQWAINGAGSALPRVHPVESQCNWEKASAKMRSQSQRASEARQKPRG